MPFLWSVGLIVASGVALLYGFLIVVALKTPAAGWQRWAGLITGLAASLAFLVDHVLAFRNHAFRIATDLRFIGLTLMVCSLLFIRKSISPARHA